MHAHKWQYIDSCCAWCVECEAESYLGEILIKD
jgi:hypothetical protein